AAGLELRAGACAMAPHWAVCLLVVELWGLGLGAEVWWNLVPRKTVSSGELATVVRRFSQTGIQDFLTLTLTEQTGLLYVGAREALFAFSVEALELQGVVREPHFVGSAYVPESVGSYTGDDDKVYFFFSERAVEYDCYAEQVVARVARVCKGDVGGARTLQRKWTTFLKARLVCSAPDWQLYFNRLQALYTLQDTSWHNTTFFGVFRARWGDMDLSAVCEYQLEEIQKVFEGPYKEYHEQAQKWGRYTDPVPTPRPGSCINNWHRRHGYTSSLELPDNILNFIKKHPLMEEQVRPRWGRPLLVKKNANLTHLVADRVSGLDGATYTVLFIGTGDGWLLKAVSLGPWVHLIEELQLFDQEPVESLVLSRSKVPADPARCTGLGGPELGCPCPPSAWASCTPLTLVFSAAAVRLTPKNITVVAGTDLVLPCRLSSNLAHARWTFGGRDLPAEQPGSFLYDARLQALVVMAAQPRHAGAYHCFSEEQGARLAAEGYLVAVVAGPSVTLEARAPLENLGLVWLAVVALGAVCLVLLLLVLSLRRRLREELEKGAKAAERTLVYPLELPKEPTSAPFRPGPETDEKLWDPVGYYYSDGSLKIVPGHARCQPGGGPPSPPPGIPGQPLPSPTRLHLGGGRNSNANGYVRLQLGGEDRGGLGHPLPELADELRRKLQQRQPLPDSNPEESSV
ncbi:SEMA4C, partial [Cervus elaphus hippelaphus]